MNEIDVEALRDALAAGEPLLLVDCREPWEWDVGHLEGALLVPLGETADRADEVAEQAASRRVVVYCHHGIRSLSAASLYRRVGIDAVSLRGGTDAWSLRIDPRLPRYG
jgi:rhodanese-related sulfurtransferase